LESQQKNIALVQFNSVQKLLRKILAHNQFYRHKLDGLNLDKNSLSDLLNTIPFTTKQELVEDQQKFPPFGTNLTFPLDHYVRYNQTSASSGSPLRWLDTIEDWQWIIHNWLTVYEKVGVNQSDRIFFAFSFGPFLGFWGAFDAAFSLGCLSIPGGGMSSVTRLHMILDNEATVLCCTPTYAIHLGEIALNEDFDLHKSKIKTIIVAGEPGGCIAATREKIEKLWPGSSVFDHHGMTEVGPVSYQCPHYKGILRIIESKYIAEVIDPVSFFPVDVGTVGELVLTTLGRYGSPLLRYRTGDLVKQIHAPVQDSEVDAFALDGGILGRADDSVSIKGVNVYPGAFEQIIRKFDEIAEYRVLYSTTPMKTDIELQIEPDGKNKNNEYLADQVQKQLNATLFLRIPVTIMKEGDLPRYEMKAKRWIRKE
jgi:phenylacetate-CoA ligase